MTIIDILPDSVAAVVADAQVEERVWVAVFAGHLKVLERLLVVLLHAADAVEIAFSDGELRVVVSGLGELLQIFDVDLLRFVLPFARLDVVVRQFRIIDVDGVGVLYRLGRLKRPDGEDRRCGD